MDRREERVGDVLDDQADRRREPVGASQRARRQVAPVAEDLDRVLHAPRQVRPHVVAAVDDARDRGEAHAREARDVLHRRPAGWSGHVGALRTLSRARTLPRNFAIVQLTKRFQQSLDIGSSAVLEPSAENVVSGRYRDGERGEEAMRARGPDAGRRGWRRWARCWRSTAGFAACGDDEEERRRRGRRRRRRRRRRSA